MGVPLPIMHCNISHNAKGRVEGGYPSTISG